MIDLNEFRKKILCNMSCIWLFNIGAEQIWFPQHSAVQNDNIEFLSGIESMNILLCQEQDYIIFRKAPDHTLLNHLKRQGLPIPHIIYLNESDSNKSISECILNESRIMALLTELKNTHVLFPYAVTFLEKKSLT